MINKKCHSAARCETIVRYIFGATLEDAHKRSDIEFMGGNITSGTPFGSTNSQDIRNVDTRAIEAEFNAKMSLYTGSGSQLVSHYVLSLPHEDKLSDLELKRVVKGFLKEMGANNSSTWVAARHNDTDCLHVHIALCRVQMQYDSDGQEKYYGLLSDKDDYDRGMVACRKLEKDFNLTPTASPGETNDHKNQAAIIRAISKKIFSTAPSTVSEFIHLMAGEGVQMKPELTKDGKIRGLSYRLNSDDGRWITGSTVMSTKLTFGAITKALNYLPSRDDSTLGLGPTPNTPVCAPFQRSARIKHVGLMMKTNILSDAVRSLARSHPHIYLIRHKSHYYAGLKLDLRFYPASPITHEQYKQLAWENMIRILFKGLMRMMKTSFQNSSFDAFPWPADCEVLSGNSCTTIKFEKLTTTNIKQTLGIAQEIMNSGEIGSHISRIAESVQGKPRYKNVTNQNLDLIL